MVDFLALLYFILFIIYIYKQMYFICNNIKYSFTFKVDVLPI